MMSDYVHSNDVSWIDDTGNSSMIDAGEITDSFTIRTTNQNRTSKIGRAHV